MNPYETHAAYNTKLLDRLEPLAELSGSTTLCMLRNTHTMYTVKHLPASSLAMLRQLSGTGSPRIAVLRAYRCTGDEIEAAFDYADGQSLHAVLEEQGHMPPEAAARVCMDVCEGLIDLHAAGIVHRDINPNNIILTRDSRAVIIDCGIARSFLGDRSADTTILGTPGYAAPEQFGFTQSDARTDLYAVGVLFNVMITGELPNVRTAGGRAGSLVNRCIAMDARNRPSSAKELGNAFRCYAEGVPEVFSKMRGAVPGFRSPRRLGRVIGAVLWAFWFFFAIASFITARDSGQNPAASLFAYCMLTLVPIIAFGNLFYLRDVLMEMLGVRTENTRKFSWILTVIGAAIFCAVISSL